jgi:hypothetical protein
VTREGDVSKRPAQAPAHSKTDAQILADLTQQIDGDITARNNIPPPQCTGCDYLGEREASVSTSVRRFYDIWEEQYELRDENGNVIRGTAKYMAQGRAEVETRVLERLCDDRFGDDPAQFYALDTGRSDVNVAYVAYDLGSVWKQLSKSERAGMKLTTAKG